MIEDFKGSTTVEPPKQNVPSFSPNNTDQTGGMPLDMAIDDIGKSKKKKRSFRIWPSHLSKKKQLIIAGLLIVLIGGIIGFFVYTQLFAKPAPVTTAPAVAPPPPPTTEASKLTGVEVAIDLNKRPVTGVMIENSPDARPQSGLTEAGVVFEAVAEGGITRFLALYQEAQPGRIGPVRSARPYYLDWALAFDASYAHVGGSPDALRQIKSLKVKDLDQFSNPNYYRRVPERYAPHNMYTSMKDLDAANKARGFKESKFTSFARKKDKPEKTPTTTRIDIALSSALYNVTFGYDAASNSYKRTMGGKPHNDEKSGKTISPKVVVAMVLKKTNDGKYSVYATTGSGKAIIFQDGKKIDATWKKPNRNSSIVFLDAEDKPLKLNAGQTWITAVGSPGEVVTKP